MALDTNTCLLQYFPNVAEVILVVSTGPGVLDRLPRHDEADEREAAGTQAREVERRLGEGKRSIDERGRIGRAGNLGRAAEVDAAQVQRPAAVVDELAAFDADATHGTAFQRFSLSLHLEMFVQ